MRKNFTDQIHDIVDEKTNKVGGPVGNLFGKVKEDVAKAAGAEEVIPQSWYIVPLVVDRSPTLEQFINQYTHDKTGFQTVNAENGTVKNGRVTTRTAVLYITAVEAASPFIMPIAVRAPGYDISIYLNNARQVATRDAAVASLSINTGRQFIMVLVHGGIADTSVRIPEDIPTFAMEPAPEPPIWNDKPLSDYLTPGQGTRVIKLAWNNDPFAGGWNVYRAKSAQMAEVDVVTDNSNGTFTVEFNSVDLPVTVGEDFYTNHFYGGKVTSVTKGVNGSIPYTHLVISVAYGAPTLAADWVDEVYAKPESYQAVAAVSYSGNSVIEWEDSDIKPNEVYVYRLTALGFLTLTTESEYSNTEWAFSNDEVAPGPVSGLAVLVGEGILVASYETPVDADFKGVRVYGPYSAVPANFTSDKKVHVEYGEPSPSTDERVRDSAAFPASGLGTYYFATFDSIGNEQSVATALSYLHDGIEDYDQPDLVVTVNDPTAATQVLDWTCDGQVSISVPAGVTHTFNSGSASSSSGQLTITRDGSDRDIVFTAFKLGVTVVDTVRVPATNASTYPPNLNVVSSLANASTMEFTFTNTDPRTSVTSGVPVTFTGVTCEKRPSGGGALQPFSSGNTLGVDETLVVTRPTSDQPVGQVIFDAAIGTGKETIEWEIFQAPSNDTAPQVKIEVLSGAWDGDLEQRVQISATNPSGGGVTLTYRWADEVSYTAATNPQTITLLRDNAPNFADRVLFVKAVNDDNALENEVSFLIDFDVKPEIVTFHVTPRFQSGQIVGWTVAGTVDDDTNSVKAVLTSGVTFASGAVALISTDTVKTFSYNLDQSAGGDGKVTITPYTDTLGTANAGPPQEAVLSRTPITTAFTKQISRTEFLLTLSAVPSSATTKWRKYRANAGAPAFSTYTVPEKITVDAAQDTIVEFYSEIAGGFNSTLIEPIQKLSLDQDHRPEVYISVANGGTIVESSANVMKMMFNIDDDCATWEVFARKGSYPTFDGTNTDLDNTLDKRYSRGVFPTTINELSMGAATGTWYIVCRGYDFNGFAGPADSRSFAVTGAPSGGSGTELSNLTVQAVLVSGNDYVHQLSWDHSAAIQTDYAGVQKYKIELYWATDSEAYTVEAVDVHPALEYTGSDTTPNEGSYRGFAYVKCTKGTSNCNYVTVYFKIELWDTSTNTLIQTLYAQRGLYGITVA